MSIRKMEIEDLRKVVELEHALFLSPWNEEDFSHELKENPHRMHTRRDMTTPDAFFRPKQILSYS